MDRNLELCNKIKNDVESLIGDRDRLLLEYNNVLKEEQICLNKIEKETIEFDNAEWKRRNRNCIKALALFFTWPIAAIIVSFIISKLLIDMGLFVTYTDSVSYVFPILTLLSGGGAILVIPNSIKKNQEGFKKYDADVAKLEQNKKECKDRINKALSEYLAVVKEIEKKEQFLREIENFDSSTKEESKNLNKPFSRKLVRNED